MVGQLVNCTRVYIKSMDTFFFDLRVNRPAKRLDRGGDAVATAVGDVVTVVADVVMGVVAETDVCRETIEPLGDNW